MCNQFTVEARVFQTAAAAPNCFDNKRQLETRQRAPCNGFQVRIATQAHHQIVKTPMIALQAESG